MLTERYYKMADGLKRSVMNTIDDGIRTVMKNAGITRFHYDLTECNPQPTVGGLYLEYLGHDGKMLSLDGNEFFAKNFPGSLQEALTLLEALEKAGIVKEKYQDNFDPDKQGMIKDMGINPIPDFPSEEFLLETTDRYLNNTLHGSDSYHKFASLLSTGMHRYTQGSWWKFLKVQIRGFKDNRTDDRNAWAVKEAQQVSDFMDENNI